MATLTPAQLAQMCQTCGTTGRRGYCAPNQCVCNHPPCPAYASSRRARSDAAAVALATREAS